MGAFVETALVADDFSGIESRATPGGGFGCMAIEASATEILGFLGSSVVCVLNWETGVGRKVGHCDWMARRGGRGAEEGSLGGDDDGCGILEFYGVGIVEMVEFVVGRMRGRA